MVRPTIHFVLAHSQLAVSPSGIAGLAAAYALAASGHRVRVLEQARGLKRCPGGVRLPPNATKILSYWGVGKEIAQKASTIPSSSILDSEYLCRSAIFFLLCGAWAPKHENNAD